MPDDDKTAQKEENNKPLLTGERNKRNRKRWGQYQFDTQCIISGEDPYPETSNSLRTPLYLTKSYAYPTMSELLKGEYYYSRTENPTLYALDQKMATLHKAEAALCVASGMAAVHLACSSILQTRLERSSAKKIKRHMPQTHPEVIPNVVINTAQYTGVYRLLSSIYPQMGIEARRVDMHDLDALQSAVDDQTKLIFFETPSNPTIDIVDIQACADIAHNAGAKCIVDNTYASPALQRPLEWGADLVVESLTKYVNGHGDCLGGIIVGGENEMRNIRYYWLETQGQVLSPFNAWLILRGIRTLGIRMERHSANALKVAQFLEAHPKVKRVDYPGLESSPYHNLASKQMANYGGMIGFLLETEEMCEQFCDRLKLIKVGVSLGDTTSLIEYTSFMTGINLSAKELKSMDIPGTHIRFSVGLENPDDLIADLTQALAF